jgi:hypothetical protein
MRRKKDIDRMHVPIEFKSFVLRKKADNPRKYRSNYDVLNDIMGEYDYNENKQKKRLFRKI